MFVQVSKKATLFRRFRRWVRNQVIQDVPNSIALCEYDCRKQQCTTEQWAACERRLSGASGELKPPALF
jgi:hypothetical protein